jgi:hypothetical protein
VTVTENTPQTDAPVDERHCRGCGATLADDQLACLQCGAVEDPAARRERRWVLPTSGLVAAALFLVTSASFAATTALNTGDPTAIKQQPPAVAQAQAPATPAAPATPPSGAAPSTGSPPVLDGSTPAAPPSAAKPAPAVPATPSTPSTPSTPPSAPSSGGHSGSGAQSGGSGAKPTKPSKPAKPVKIPEWPKGRQGYTVIVYKFNTKSDAVAKAREVAARKLPVGVLKSDDFKSLDPGSWLVYIGRFDTAQQAQKAQDKYSGAGYPGEVTFVGDTNSPEYQPGNGDPGSGSGGGSGSGTTTGTTPAPPAPLPQP